MTTLDKSWHLAQGENGIQVAEFELQLWRVFFGFLRWQEECNRSVNGIDLTGNELAVLHIVRMKERPKTIYDIGRLLNRDDTFNIHYSLRKLLKIGLIEKAKSAQSGKKTYAYQITEAGIKNTDAYAEMRNNILIKMFNEEANLNLNEVTKSLTKIKAIYDEADRDVASYSTRKNKK
jgi:predicted MarR family transcription regulator